VRNAFLRNVSELLAERKLHTVVCGLDGLIYWPGKEERKEGRRKGRKERKKERKEERKKGR